jgi:Flp pilus assembly secretin CpaC
MNRILVVTAALALLCSTAAQANTPDSCQYFQNYMVMLRTAQIEGKTKDQTIALARAKAKTDHLSNPMRDLFVGEAIGLYYDNPIYHGSVEDVSKKAYDACINNKLP